MLIYEWGVDSAQNVTEDLFQCVARNFGYPRFWGRYLERISGFSEGLTEQEALFIHSKRIKILPIYNAFREATGYLQGRAAADSAVLHAQRLGIPRGTPLFADVEPHFQVDEEWIRGWTEAIVRNGYQSGIYNDPLTGDFNNAFCNAVKGNERIKLFNILWSCQPVLEPSGPWNAPTYNPAIPRCGGNVWVWQYSRNITLCPIDTNLADSCLVNALW